MADLATSARLPRPEIDDVGDCVTVRFREVREARDLSVESELNERQSAVSRTFTTFRPCPRPTRDSVFGRSGTR